MSDVNTCILSQADGRILALYSHLIPAAAVMLLGGYGFALSKERYKAGIFLAFTICFVLWLLGDLANWMLSSYYWVAATWEPLDLIEISFFILLFLFQYVDHEDAAGRNPSRLVLIGSTALALIPFLMTIAGKAVGDMDLQNCEMLDNAWFARYKLAAEAVIILATVGISIRHVRQVWSDKTQVLRAVFTSASIVVFLGLFAGVEYISTATGVFETMLYTLFVLPLFVLVLTLSLTSFDTLNLGRTAARLLFFIFLLMSGTQFISISSLFDFFVAVVGFISVFTLGIMLFRSLSREEELVKELEIVNAQQVNLLHFISHEVKGSLNKAQGVFAGFVEGDYGPLPDGVRSIAREALGEVGKGITMVMDLLTASDLKKGTMSFDKKTFDCSAAVRQAVDNARIVGKSKGLHVEYVSPPTETIRIAGDEQKLMRHVFRNLLENAVRYTPSGSVRASLVRAGTIVRFVVEDTGVGITPEDMQRLFTEGGHGKESIKVNVDSTGFGLFIAKQVVDSHGGRIWAESEGAGNGSRFIVELPAS
jgi:signal transduction histidine kinase